MQRDSDLSNTKVKSHQIVDNSGVSAGYAVRHSKRSLTEGYKPKGKTSIPRTIPKLKTAVK